MFLQVSLHTVPYTSVRLLVRAAAVTTLRGESSKSGPRQVVEE